MTAVVVESTVPQLNGYQLRQVYLSLRSGFMYSQKQRVYNTKTHNSLLRLHAIEPCLSIITLKSTQLFSSKEEYLKQPKRFLSSPIVIRASEGTSSIQHVLKLQSESLPIFSSSSSGQLFSWNVQDLQLFWFPFPLKQESPMVTLTNCLRFTTLTVVTCWKQLFPMLTSWRHSKRLKSNSFNNGSLCSASRTTKWVIVKLRVVRLLSSEGVGKRGCITLARTHASIHNRDKPMLYSAHSTPELWRMRMETIQWHWEKVDLLVNKRKWEVPSIVTTRG